MCACVHDESWTSDAYPGAYSAAEVVRRPQACGCRQHGTDSGRQFVAALAAASGQNGAAGASPHPGAEAMGAAATAVAGLESALGHGIAPLVCGGTSPGWAQGEEAAD